MPSISIVATESPPGHPLRPRLDALREAGWTAGVVSRAPRWRRPDVLHLASANGTGAPDLIHVESDGLRDLAVRHGTPAERVHVVAPVAEASAPHEGRDGVLRLYGAEPLSWEAGYEDALVAVRLLADQGVPVEYRIPAEGRFRDAVEFARFELGLQGEVVLGAAPDGDVLLSAAVAPVSPKAALDAMAGGRVVVTTEPIGPALVAPPRDPEALAELLGRVAVEPSTRARAGEDGRRYAAGFTAERQVGLYLELYTAAASVTSAATSSIVQSSASEEIRARSSS